MVEAFDILRRNPQDPTTSLATIITRPSGDITTSFSALVTASAPPTILTTATTTPTVTSHVSSSVSASSAAATTSTAARPAPNHVSTLIPAIVAPVVVVLVLAFGLFWWFMRRSAQRARKDEPEFVMEHRNEKSHNRKGSAHSQSSTRNLVSRADTVPVKKEATSDVTEVMRPSLDHLPVGKRQSSGIGFDVSKFPIPGNDHSRQTSTVSHDPSGPPMKPSVAVRNFSRGPTRPNTGTRESDSSTGSFLQPRNLSSPIPKPLNVANGAQKRMPTNTKLSQDTATGPWVPPKNPNRKPGTSHSTSPPRSGTTTPDRRPAPAPPVSKDKPLIQQPQSRLNATPAPAAPNRDQYSTRPDVTTATTAPQPTINTNQQTPEKPTDKRAPRKSPPTAIKTGSSPPTQSSADFSEENMRIARLADSSRLGFYPSTAVKASTTVGPIQDSSRAVEPPSHSPRLPPPATRDAPPSVMNIPLPPPPAEPVLPSPNSRRADSFAPDRKSVRSLVSRLSSDGGYIDMEIDDKSDVSSLDERERWQVEQHARIESRSGFGGYGAVGPARHPPPLSRRQGTDSDASGSMYSLGRH